MPTLRNSIRLLKIKLHCKLIYHLLYSRKEKGRQIRYRQGRTCSLFSRSISLSASDENEFMPKLVLNLAKSAALSARNFRNGDATDIIKGRVVCNAEKRVKLSFHR